MHLVTDRAADLTSAQLERLDVHFMPLTITLEGKSYSSGIDLQPAEFYELLERTGSYPVTSQPSAGEFAELYRRLAQTDPDILSIHVASGLSGTIDAARAGAAMVPEANVTIFDSLTLSCPLGWLVEAAGRGLQRGWEKERILDQLRIIQANSQGLFTLNSLKYLIHGGRISHMKGLLASVLNIKPIIGPDKQTGKYHLFAQEFSMGRALSRIPDIVAQLLPGKRLRVQLLHGQNPGSLEVLRQAMSRRFDCCFDPDAIIAPVLGAHTGPSITGLAVGDLEAFGELI